MNAQNLTQKSLEAVQTAQSMAQENRNNYIMPEHLLYALVDQDGGLIPSLFGKMGVDCNALLAELDTVISGFPKVGNTTDVYLSQETGRILTAAEKAAKYYAEKIAALEEENAGLKADLEKAAVIPAPVQKAVLDIKEKIEDVKSEAQTLREDAEKRVQDSKTILTALLSKLKNE